MAGYALLAFAAEGRAGDNPISFGEAVHSRADGLDDSSAFVTEDDGQRDRIPLVAEDGVGVADPGG